MEHETQNSYPKIHLTKLHFLFDLSICCIKLNYEHAALELLPCYLKLMKLDTLMNHSFWTLTLTFLFTPKGSQQLRRDPGNRQRLVEERLQHR